MAAFVFLGKYEVLRPLGEGSMGQVFLATDMENGRQVAVKVLHKAVAKQSLFRELFEREMEVMSKFQHPNVVAVYEASATDPTGLCMVMEYVPGTDLEVVLRETGRLTVERTGRILGQLCSALQAAHDEGIIHRDLKPANIMIMNPGTDHERVKIMDFGLAKLSDSVYISLDKLKGDVSELATGTAEYMAPEQVRGDALDHRGDLYSLGVMLFEMLTGKLPFDPPGIHEVLMAHAEEPVPSFESKDITDVPKGVEKLVHWCLAKFPVERPQGAWELGKAFEAASGLKILDESQRLTPSGILRTAGGTGGQVPDNAYVQEMEAFMPERIAVVKLRGFVQDVGGEMVESVPGLIRVRFGKSGCRYQVPVPRGGPLGWIAGPKRTLIDVELRMRKTEASGSGLLRIILLIRPEEGGAPPKTPTWDLCCKLIFKDLRAYLMGH
jgi:serine/threonine-protein kinase